MSEEREREMYRIDLETVLQEIAKCDLVCARCHRTRTYWKQQRRKKPDRNGRISAKRNIVQSIKASTPCWLCGGWFDPWQMDFDHVVGKKRFCIGSMVFGAGTLEALFDEIGKVPSAVRQLSSSDDGGST